MPRSPIGPQLILKYEAQGGQVSSPGFYLELQSGDPQV